MPSNAEENSRGPTISIYQNPDHVVGLLQQMFSSPLITGESRETSEEDKSGEKLESRTKVAAKGSGSIPGVVSGGLDGAYDRARTNGSDAAKGMKLVQSFEYSQAFYLYRVRSGLIRRGILKTVAAAEDAEKLKVGDFVEFSSYFRPNELHAMLDILTPDLLAAGVRFQYKRKMLSDDMFPTGDDVDYNGYFEKIEAQASLRADMTRAVAEAIRVDFRAEKTREFYGEVVDGLTAITVCDASKFVVEDEDRILDGCFTVLGKITSDVIENRPILSRNKVLERLKPTGVDELFGLLQDGLASQADDQLAEASRSALSPDDLVDLHLRSRIAGASFHVVPIAIFA